MLFCCRCFTFSSSKRDQSQSHSQSQTTSYTTASNFNPSTSSNLPVQKNNLRVFTKSELNKATEKFNDSRIIIGEGRFGIVYWGMVESHEPPFQQIKVAVKVWKQIIEGHNREWLDKVTFIGGLDHSNLVKLLGYGLLRVKGGEKLCLVYEHMAKGSLKGHLSGGTTLSWVRRLRVAQDVARALVYLHDEMSPKIIFEDLMSANYILIDDQWNAKLSDFGLKRLGPEVPESHCRDFGLRPYAAPEYILTGHASSGGDVWSFGVLLYKLAMGTTPKEYPDLERRNGKTKEDLYTMDPKLKEMGLPEESVSALADIAELCLEYKPKARATMSQVLEKLNRLVDEEEKVVTEVK